MKVERKLQELCAYYESLVSYAHTHDSYAHL